VDAHDHEGRVDGEASKQEDQAEGQEGAGFVGGHG